MRSAIWILAIFVIAALVQPGTAIGDCSVSQKVVLGDTSPATPALASLNGVLFIAWSGTDNAHRLNLMSSTDMGLTFGHKFTSAETSPEAPSLAVHAGRLFIAWSGTGNRRLNVAVVDTQSGYVSGFSQKRTLGDTSPGTPSLASLNGRLYLAWNGTDNAHRLNVMFSTDGGASFGNKYTAGETSPAGPALVAHNGKLYIAWTGTGNQHLNVAEVNTPAVTGFAGKQTLGDTSPATPSLASLSGRLYMAWNGTDSAHRLNAMSSSNIGQSFGNKYTYAETSPVAPSLAVHGGVLYITWRGTGNAQLNVARVNEMPVTRVTLAVAMHAQETSNWCWAASGEMVMEFLGRDIAQCTEANTRFGLNNCCNIALCPSPAAPQYDSLGNCIGCVCGGWPQFDKFGFNFQKTNDLALTWDQLSDQLNCKNKPVAFSWGWQGGGGHMMVARGLLRLSDGTQWVQIDDPWAPCKGDVRYITYAVYDHLAGDHDHWDDYYDITRR